MVGLDKTGKRSTTSLGREVVSLALGDADRVGAAAALRETDWRSGYPQHFRRLVEAGLHDRETALGIAERGLAAVRERMAVAERDERPLAAVFDTEIAAPLQTEVVRGSAEPAEEFSLPYQGKRLRGAALTELLHRWQETGIVEPGVVDAIAAVMAHPEWLALPGRCVTVLGAGAEMGPLHSLLSWGAEVVAVDLPRPELWRGLSAQAADSAGVFRFPATDGRPGADLLHDLPRVAQWLKQIEGPQVLGNYVYADGAINLRLSAATDALATELMDTCDDMALAYLATPTDVFGVPGDGVEQSVTAYENRKLRSLRPLLKGASGGRLLRRNHRPGEDPGLADAIIPQQGPNYLLAKRIHRWRASVARRAGRRVSMLVAPPTKTRSVMKNRALAAAYGGAHRFGVEVFEPSTSNTLMAALMVHDLMSEPSTPTDPWREEARNAVPGGLWRGPYDPRSALGIALVLGWGAARG